MQPQFPNVVVRWYILILLCIIPTIGGVSCSPRAKPPITNTSMFSEDVYIKLKQGLKTDLPEDYVSFLRAYDGNVPAAKSFSVVPNDWGSGIHELYLMQEAGDHRSLLRGLDWKGLPLKPGLFPIGGDGSFGYILISLRPQDRGSIHFCCTWSTDGKTDVYASQGYWRIADSFTAFMSTLTKEA